MRTFTPETAIAALELEQMVVDWCRELDLNGGHNSTDFFSEDCIVEVGAISYKGHAAMRKHYEDNAQAIRTDQKGGIRTARHAFTNLRIAFAGSTSSTLTFLMISFSAEGQAPLMNTTIPTIVTDCRFECRRDVAGQWRIFGFYGAPVFVGNDSFLNKAVLQQ